MLSKIRMLAFFSSHARSPVFQRMGVCGSCCSGCGRQHVARQRKHTNNLALRPVPVGERQAHTRQYREMISRLQYPSELDMIECLWRDGTANIQLGELIQHGMFFTVKRFPNTSQGLELYHAELEILMECANGDCPFILCCFGGFQERDHLNIMLESHLGGSLQDLRLQPDLRCLRESHARFIMAELIVALDKVQEAGYLHTCVILRVYIPSILPKPTNVTFRMSMHVWLPLQQRLSVHGCTGHRRAYSIDRIHACGTFPSHRGSESAYFAASPGGQRRVSLPRALARGLTRAIPLHDRPIHRLLVGRRTIVGSLVRPSTLWPLGLRAVRPGDCEETA